ncbi:Ig-like domain-containing protein [Candidatus Palauibacter sp.]|uniref:Ig-like domain-containing protein n=1 Tax=Candidatus Palauibacter sp. TaxID=3101350 RepID=UPI003B52E870
MNRHLNAALVVAALAGLAGAAACGDGATDPPAPDPLRPATVTVTPATVQFRALGATAQLAAEVRDQNGQTMAGAGVTWLSSAPAVASVSSTGQVTAAGNGTATITANAGSASGTSMVTVAQEVSVVAVSPAADTLVAGDTLRLSAVAVDANDHAIEGVEFAYASSDTLVAVVDDAGLVTGISEGQTEVTAAAAGVTGRAELTVEAPAPTTVAVTPDAVALTALGETMQLSAEVRDQAGRVMEDIQLSWSSTDTTVAAVDSTGLVTAVARGTTTVAATAGEASGEAVVTVMQSVGSVVVSPPADTVALGDTLRLVAEAFDRNGHAVEGAEFGWSSSNGSVARVDDSGLVTGLADGTATITAMAGDASDTSEITVENPDRAALVALYNATDGSNWTRNDNWLTDAPLGEWYGVDADASGRVVALHLGGTWRNGEYVAPGLSGAIPPEIGALTRLVTLDLDGNDLSGAIPPELGKLANLTALDLRWNDLTGEIPPELGDLASLKVLLFYGNHLSGDIPPELGNLTSLTYLGLGENRLTGRIPPTLGRLANLETLRLYFNRLTGPIPPELGDLGDLRSLLLGDNDLTGPIPQTLLRLDRLQSFYIGRNETLCVPGSSPFVAWLRRIEHRDDDSESPFCNAADAAVLGQLYELAGGTGWTRSDGWAGDGALEERHGVSADSLGRVTTLDLTANGLAGQLPPTLGKLTRMTKLRVADNPGLSGRLPLSLANLSLAELRYVGTGLCVPANQSLEDWLNTISSHAGTGRECAPLTDREILEILYDVTGGPTWTSSRNWLTDAPLGEWHGVRVDDRGRVVELSFLANGLEGEIPAELGDLTELRSLRFARHRHRLTGPIPAQLANLANLESLLLYSNALEGEIPPELGSLEALVQLRLHTNELEGAIPPELGDLSSLTDLSLQDNELEGAIPAELGDLAELRWLNLQHNRLQGSIPVELAALPRLRRLDIAGNRLTGAVPREFGSVSTLETLVLAANDLTGPVPAELGAMAALRELAVANNAGLSGRLPAELTALGRLEALTTGGTGLCAPSDSAFQRWLNGIRKRRVSTCDEEESAATYLTQAVQSREFPVPLVAGEKALLRVFPTAARTSNAGIPPVRARFYLDDREAHVANAPGKSGSIPTEVSEDNLSKSANIEIPGSVVQPGLELVIEVDPGGTLDPGLGVAARIPETGRLAVAVEAMPTLELTAIPFLWSPNPDSLVLDLVEAMVDDPDNHELLGMTRTLLPIEELVLTAHEPVMTSHNHSGDLLRETEAIRVLEGRPGYYLGTMTGEHEGTDGLAFGVPSRTSFSMIDRGERSELVIVHELGHNMSLQHPPGCEAGRPDYSYPHANGWIGVWGYDFDSERLVRPATGDLMSYCRFEWISDYHFSNALRHRLTDERETGASAIAGPAASLLLWGGVGAEGVPFLEPTFVVDAPPALPDSGGAYQITGQTKTGGELFSFSFAMPEVADGDGSSSFAFVLPVRAGWEDSLAAISLTGPGGSFTLDSESDFGMAILRNPGTGQVRGFLRDLPAPPTRAAMAAAEVGVEPGLEVLFSRGIPDAASWR